MENAEVDFDAELLGRIIDEGDVCAKQVARVTAYSIDTVYAYRHGRVRIPMRFWRDLFKATQDLRIPRMIFGDTSVEIVLHERLPDLGTDKEQLRAAIESAGKYYEQQKYLANILADGRIDETDHEAMRNYGRAHFEHIVTDAALFKAVTKAYNERVSAR